jgi:hypothetical protein
MIKTRLLALWVAGHGRSVSEAAELLGQFEVVGFPDAATVGERLFDRHVMGAVSGIGDHRSVADQAVVAIGNNAIREKLMKQLTGVGYVMVTVIHPRAFVSPSAVVCLGSAIIAGAIADTEALLGVGSIVNCGTVVDRHSIVGDFDCLGVNASMSSGTVLGRSAWMQAGAVLESGVKVASGEVLPPETAREMSRPS